MPKFTDVILILFDCPAKFVLRSILNFFKPKITICLIAERIKYQPSYFRKALQLCDIVIHSSEFPFSISSARSIKSVTSYVYKEIPFVSNSLINHFQTSIFCSNIISGDSSLYSFRRQLINISCKLFGSKFLHCGKNWTRSSEYSSLRSYLKETKYALKRVIYRTPNVSLSSYYGAPLSKNILSFCKTTYAVENSIDVYGYTTEKALEPLSYGCFPIYVGYPTNNWLSSFIPVYPPDSFEILANTFKVIAKDKASINQEVASIRDDINSYLSAPNSTSLKVLYSLLHDFI